MVRRKNENETQKGGEVMNIKGWLYCSGMISDCPPGKPIVGASTTVVGSRQADLIGTRYMRQKAKLS
jgi:hypothetical protein